MQLLTATPLYEVPRYSDIREMYMQSAKKYADSPAYQFRYHPSGDIITKSYIEFTEDMRALGTALLHMGAEKQKVAIIGENSYRWALSYATLLSGGGVAVPLDRLLTEEEILGLLARGEVSAVFFDGYYLDVMKKAQETIPAISHFICMRGNRYREDRPEDFCTDPGFHRFDTLLEEGRSLLSNGSDRWENAGHQPEDMVALLFTSGTTSLAKAVMLSAENLVSDVYGLGQMERFPVGIRCLSVLSMHHTFESTCGLLYAFSSGICCCISDGLRYVAKNINEYRVHLLVGVPILFDSFYKKIQAGLKEKGKLETVQRMMKITGFLAKIGIDVRRRIFKEILASFGGEFRYGICGAAPIDPKIIHFLNGIGIEIYQGYGLTETSPVIAANNRKFMNAGTVGKPMGGATIAIDTDTDFEEGEILVKGPMVMMGYYQEPELTREAIDKDGWFHTGDVGRIDKKTGCLYITGRIKSMIVLKNGKKVFPEELEQGITRMPYVKEALVFGETVDDDEVIVSAKVVFDKEAMEKDGVAEETIPESLQSLIRESNAKLPSYKAVRQWVYGFEPMEKTTTLKIKRMDEVKKLLSYLADKGFRMKNVHGQKIDLTENVHM